MKTEPNAELRQFASLMRQMFVALMDEGFSKQEALAITAEVIRAQMGGKP